MITSLHRAKVTLTNEAALDINYYEPNEFNPARSHVSVLRVGHKDLDKQQDPASLTVGSGAVARLGNGYIQVMNNGTLTLDKNSSVTFGSHNDGLFEKASANAGKAEDHFSIELNKGSTFNVNIDADNKIHADHILSKDHTHAVIGQPGKGADTPWFNLSPSGSGSTGSSTAGVNLSMTQAVIDRVQSKVKDNSFDDQKLAGQENIAALKKLLDTGALQAGATKSLQDLHASALSKGVTEEEFYQAMGAFLTLGLKRENGWQDYRFTMDANGVYINGEAVRQWENMTKVKLSLQNLTNETVALLFKDHDNVPVSGAVNLIHHVVEHYTMDVEPANFYLAARMIDSAGQLVSVGGAQTIAWDMLQNRRDSFSRQRDRAFERILPGETNLWADGLFMRNKSNGLWNDLNGDRDVSTDLSGVIAGLDHKVSPTVLLGGSLSVLRGDSTGELGAGLPKVENDIDSYAGSLYGTWALTDNSRIVWDVAVQNGKNDVSMQFQSFVGDKPLYKTEADADTWAAQLTAGYQYDFHLANVTLTPFALLQYTYLRTQGYTTTVDGLDAFHVDAAKQNIYSIPVGVKASADFTFAGNLALRPWMSLYVQPNFGDKDVDNRVTAVGLTSVDHVSPDVIGDTSYGAAAGVNFITGETFSSGLSYSFNGSDSSKNHSFTLNAVWKF
ncbi:autotransporter outer membrane beta-barrel domain-containing protein [uncultured Sutterella sp.]|uniref:autotransporter outer membrane beta-barrel domain-containing protein n=1 Tax=uncultured Sutterella sp. TaxID=286133 RepID=UPI0026294BD3|nr:autotransporter outer membrane beta-barrel domain-containing protein [uncultured Sutterella sp.]